MSLSCCFRYPVRHGYVKIAVLLLAIIMVAAHSAGTAEVDLGQGLLAGTPTPTGIILQARLTDGRQLIEGDLPGRRGVAQFEISPTKNMADARRTEWLRADPDSDYIVKTRLDELQPSTRYYYRVIYGIDKNQTKRSTIGTFKTLGGPTSSDRVSFVAVTGMNHYFFHYGSYYGPHFDAAPTQERRLGYPALEAIRRLEPDFFVGTGDNVYYDHPNTHTLDHLQSLNRFPPTGGWNGNAKTRSELRRKYHEQFSQPRFIDLFDSVPTYWQKDDHDYRFDDSDPYMDAARYRSGDGRPSHDLAVATFQEQLPVPGSTEAGALPYGSFRVSRDMQIWLVEGREFRSPNNMPDGPQKSLWGRHQRDWLKRTLLASNATFKLLIHPTPLVGPQDNGGEPFPKMDNHINSKGFRYERQDFFDWLAKNDFLDKGFFIICGDSHWPYHAIDPSGVEEFCTGALVTQNATVGARPGDPNCSDPLGKINQPFHPDSAMATFLYVELAAGSDNAGPLLRFTHCDQHGRKLYSVEKSVSR